MEKDFDPLPLPVPPAGVSEPPTVEALLVFEGLADATPAVVDFAEDALLTPAEGFTEAGVEDAVVDLASVADDAGRAASAALVEKPEPDGLEVAVEAFESEPKVGDAPALDGFASTFAGFRSIVTGRLGTPVPAVVVDAVSPPLSGDLPSPEEAAPDGEDLPPEGSLSDAM